MADLVITAADVKKITTGTSTIVNSGVAGETIVAGEALYKDEADSKMKKADADGAAGPADMLGIALHGALLDQPISYATGGELTISAVMTAGEFYFLSGTAGKICPTADLLAGDRKIFIGYARTTAVLVLQITNTGILLA